MVKIRVPSLAENVHQATVAEWLVAVGDRVEPGQGVVSMLTEKAEFTLEAETGGMVTALLAPVKSVLPVGTILCLLDAKEAEVQAARQENEAIIQKLLTADTIHEDLEAPRPASPRPGGDIRATPAARRLAREAGADLAQIAEALRIEGPIKEEHVRAYVARR